MTTLMGNPAMLGSTAMMNRLQLEGELHDLRERLADAWWNEKPLSEIQRLEHRIAECKRKLTRPEEQIAN